MLRYCAVKSNKSTRNFWCRRLRVLLGQWGRCRPIYFVVAVVAKQKWKGKSNKERKSGWFLSLWSAQLALIYCIMSLWNASLLVSPFSYPTKKSSHFQLNAIACFCSAIGFEFKTNNFPLADFHPSDGTHSMDGLDAIQSLPVGLGRLFMFHNVVASLSREMIHHHYSSKANSMDSEQPTLSSVETHSVFNDSVTPTWRRRRSHLA